MEKTATCLRAELKKEVQGRNGKLYVHNVQFDNGDQGEYLSQAQSQDKFVVNQKATYTIEYRQDYPAKIKPVRQNNFAGGGKVSRQSPEEQEYRNKQIVSQSSVKAAVEMATHGQIEVKHFPSVAKKIFDLTYDIAKDMSMQEIKEKYGNGKK